MSLTEDRPIVTERAGVGAGREQPNVASDVRRFDIVQDLSVLNSWLAARDLAPLSASKIPAIGFIVPGFAVGFLIETNIDTCYLEHFVTNPATKPLERSDAIDAIVGELLYEASRLSYQSVLSITRIPSIFKRALRWGFEPIGNGWMLAGKELS